MAEKTRLTALTARIAAEFVANNHVSHNDMGGLIAAIYAGLSALDRPRDLAQPAPEFVPAVTVRKSLADPTTIISMIDGKPYKMLKRHLTTRGLTPAEYRARYHLPNDYPMIAPAYSQLRKALALKIGLGRNDGSPATPALATPGSGVALPAPKAPVKSRALSGKAALAKVRKPAERASSGEGRRPDR